MSAAPLFRVMIPGERLRQERWRLRLTETAMASRLGVSASTLLQAERGEIPIFNIPLAALRNSGVDGFFVLTGEKTDNGVTLVAAVEMLCQSNLSFLPLETRVVLLIKMLQREADLLQREIDA